MYTIYSQKDTSCTLHTPRKHNISSLFSMHLPCVHAGCGGHKQVESTKHKLCELSLPNWTNNGVKVVTKTIN